MTSDEVVYLVDWDLPESPPGHRRAFYRQLSQLCRKADAEWSRSTQSVFKTPDRSLAQAVFVLAGAFGRANLYKACLEEVSQV